MGYYKLLSLTDRENNIKEEMQIYKQRHPEMIGYIHNIDAGQRLYYRWRGEDKSTLVTSSVKSYTVRDDGTIEVITRNSIYHFIRINN